MKEKSITVNEKTTLLEALINNLPDLSRKKLKSFLKYEMVEVDGRVVTNANQTVIPGSTIKIYFSKRVIDEFDLNIIYEDGDIIAIDKPAGLLSISNSKEKEVTAFRMVSDHLKKDNPSSKLFVVHRLDQGTSGVLIFAKNERIKKMLQESWNDIVEKREYVAVVEGKINDKGTIESYLAMNHFQKVYSTKNKEGWFARTHYKKLKYKNGYTLLEVDIDTGRRNQIRVHLSEAGYPVTGDKKYGAKKNPINRLALHASVLEFVDPRTGATLKLEVQVPSVIRHLVD